MPDINQIIDYTAEVLRHEKEDGIVAERVWGEVHKLAPSIISLLWLWRDKEWKDLPEDIQRRKKWFFLKRGRIISFLFGDNPNGVEWGHIFITFHRKRRFGTEVKNIANSKFRIFGYRTILKKEKYPGFWFFCGIAILGRSVTLSRMPF